MKRILMVMLALGMAALLVACERPLQEEQEVQAEPTIPLVVTPLGNAPALPDTQAPAIDPGADNAPVEGETGDPGTGDAGTGEATDPGAATQPTEGETPAEVTQPAEPTTPEGNIIHTVVAGDTLYNLSRVYDVSVNDITLANQLANPNVLSVGDQLIIPTAGLPAPDPATERTHVVSAGDTLYRIGLIYGFTIADLATYNSLSNPNALEVGQVIRIPPGP